MEKQRTIFLTGFMGAGKTTVGQALSKELGMNVIDTDQYIEQQQQKSIKDIFAEEGEGQFRRYEREVLQLLPKEDTIITTGGGMVIQSCNREYMMTSGYVVYLHCDWELLLSRLQQDTTRPLAGPDVHRINELYKSRHSFYEEADYIINTTDKTVEEIVQQLTEWIEKTWV
ncbi:shikimate kinase [Priestia taiwanensis]|uniref:Shikimate kinase n=1 Tax=Priestia taiwanensis TaxID=1347902 RepID=A0A917AUE3_9BACI|nr:shikimate kinase [Priestia taiwanensis]MBM7363816.1 shikimate kinase [Priestia taiwanensis]GGE73891.1 shikimate kinase [Priestia taiwanensis]